MSNLSKVEKLIREESDAICDLLISKNRAYGNTATNPPQIFSKLTSEEAILARLDDKLSRIKASGINDKTEDTVLDIIGYLILYRVNKKLSSQSNEL